MGIFFCKYHLLVCYKLHGVEQRYVLQRLFGHAGTCKLGLHELATDVRQAAQHDHAVLFLKIVIDLVEKFAEECRLPGGGGLWSLIPLGAEQHTLEVEYTLLLAAELSP